MWRALRPILLPILRDLVGESARIFLDPCCRVLFWQRRAIVLRMKGRPARWASWRYRVNRDRCEALTDGHCTAAEAADEAAAHLIELGSDLVEDLIAAPAHRLREVSDLLGEHARQAARALGPH